LSAYKGFSSEQQSHEHSLYTLEGLFEYDDFMESVASVVDMGCGSGLDLEWWASRTTRDDVPTPLNIKCTGVDLLPELSVANRYKNITYRNIDFENGRFEKNKFDVLWCHDAFQYVINPLETLKQWWNTITPGGMMVIIVPQFTNIELRRQAFDQPDYCYNNWTMVNLIHHLAVSGFDCQNGFFQKAPNDPWIHAIVYKSDHEPMNPRTTKWYELSEKNLLPDSAVTSINKYGYLRQQDLILPWLDKSISWMGQQ
jgi:SAM-dependent methyltransferase